MGVVSPSYCRLSIGLSEMRLLPPLLNIMCKHELSRKSKGGVREGEKEGEREKGRRNEGEARGPGPGPELWVKRPQCDVFFFSFFYKSSLRLAGYAGYRRRLLPCDARKGGEVDEGEGRGMLNECRGEEKRMMMMKLRLVGPVSSAHLLHRLVPLQDERCHKQTNK